MVHFIGDNYAFTGAMYFADAGFDPIDHTEVDQRLTAVAGRFRADTICCARQN